eukprot:31154-Pelagococcus_subviridis.AAC.9
MTGRQLETTATKARSPRAGPRPRPWGRGLVVRRTPASPSGRRRAVAVAVAAKKTIIPRVDGRSASSSSHAVVLQVVRQVTDARVAVPALDVLVVRADDHARRRLAHEQTVAPLRRRTETIGRGR